MEEYYFYYTFMSVFHILKLYKWYQIVRSLSHYEKIDLN